MLLFLSEFPLVPRVWNLFQKRFELHRASDATVAIQVDARVRVIAIITHDPRRHRLVARVVERAKRLQHIAQTTVEVIRPLDRTGQDVAVFTTF